MVKCICCNGTGTMDEPNHKEVDMIEVKKEMAVKLHAKGYSYRQIMKALGYKSTRSISLLLK
jgi:transposase